MKHENFIVLDYNEFDKLVNRHVPSAKKKYEFVAAEEARNDNSYIYRDVTSKISDLDFEDILKGKLEYEAYFLLAYLCQLKVIEEGSYIIEVCW